MYFSSLERMAWSADIMSSIKFLLFPEKKNVFQIFNKEKNPKPFPYNKSQFSTITICSIMNVWTGSSLTPIIFLSTIIYHLKS